MVRMIQGSKWNCRYSFRGGKKKNLGHQQSFSSSSSSSSRKKAIVVQQVRRAAGWIAPKSQRLSPILSPGGWSVPTRAVLVLKPQSLAAPDARREGAVLAVLVDLCGSGCGLVGSVLAAVRWEVPRCFRTVPPSTTGTWSTIHPPPSISISTSPTPFKNNCRQFLAENASPWSCRLAEPLPQAIDQADDASPDSVACQLHSLHTASHGGTPAPETEARTGQTA